MTEQLFDVELIRVIRTRVRVTAASAAAIRRRVADLNDSYADDLWHDGADECDGVRCGAVVPVKREA